MNKDNTTARRIRKNNLADQRTQQSRMNGFVHVNDTVVEQTKNAFTVTLRRIPRLSPLSQAWQRNGARDHLARLGEMLKKRKTKNVLPTNAIISQRVRAHEMYSLNTI